MTSGAHVGVPRLLSEGSIGTLDWCSDAVLRTRP